MIGKRFNRIIVLERDYSKKNGTYWICRCNCGNIKTIRGSHLRSGKIQSCGCLRRTVRITHGMTNTRTYEAWSHMKQRCNNQNDKKYKDYGGRGIKVCDRWLKFENFLADMGMIPVGLTLERKDNELGYFKENCCYDDYVAQGRNQRIKKTNKTGVRGVHFAKQAGKYYVQIRANHKTHNIGYYSTIERAAKARRQAEVKFWEST